MTQPNATKPATKRTNKPVPPALDLTSLTVESAPAPRRVGGGREAGPNPFVDHIRKSWEGKSVSRQYTENGTKKYTYLGEGLAVNVPAANVDQVVNLIRNAANREGLGVAVIADKAVKGIVRVRFAAKTRKQKKATS